MVCKYLLFYRDDYEEMDYKMICRGEKALGRGGMYNRWGGKYLQVSG
jgi:hypothetical protein